LIPLNRFTCQRLLVLRLMVRNWYKLYWQTALSQTSGAPLRLSTMQVYDLLASYNLYLETDQPLRKHPFQLTLRIAPEHCCVVFEVSLLSEGAPRDTVAGRIDPLLGLHRYQLVNAVSDLDFPLECWHPFSIVGLNLFRAFEANDLLYIVVQGSFDEQYQILIHHAVVDADQRSPLYQPVMLERTAESLQLASLNGSVACIGSGAGLVMATADALRHLTADPRLEVHALAEIEEAYLLQRLQDLLVGAVALKVQIIVVTVYTTFISCESVADVVLQFHFAYPQIRLIVHLEGVDADESRLKLQAANVQAVHGMANIAQALHLTSER
jgi:succinyl-CoA synthetase beta subunit